MEQWRRGSPGRSSTWPVVVVEVEMSRVAGSGKPGGCWASEEIRKLTGEEVNRRLSRSGRDTVAAASSSRGGGHSGEGVRTAGFGGG